MRKTLQQLLANLARKVLAKYKPRIVGITGSVGKTSTKEAVFFVLSQHFRVYRPSKNFNNEYGLPLAILQIKDSPGRNVFGWLLVILKGFQYLLFSQKYPEVLVLEYGVDRIGDMDYLISIAKPDIAVITAIGVSHYEFFKDAAAIETEKSKLVSNLAQTGTAVLNADNEKALAQTTKTRTQVISYGKNQLAVVRLLELRETFSLPVSSSLTIQNGGEQFSAQVSALGGPHISSVLAAAAVGHALGVDSAAVASGIAEYRPMPGRLNFISGIKHSVVIDDTYNAAPDSMREALELFRRFPASHKFAVLGDMLELGALSDQAHADMGKLVAEIAPSKLITVGSRGQQIADAAIVAGLSKDQTISCATSDEAKMLVQSLLEPESLVLVKGSQGVRMEKIVKEIMAEPMRAEELLCRQDKSWINKK